MIRALPLTLLVVGLPAPAFAHAGHAASEDVNMTLLYLGIAGIAAGLALRGSARWRWLPWGVLALAGGLVAAALILPRTATPSETTMAVLEIRRPRDGAEVPAGEPFTVAVDLQNAPLARSFESEAGGHLHLYVDGALQQMPYSMRAEVTLEPGEHEIAVEYVDHQHVSYEPPVREAVEVVAR